MGQFKKYLNSTILALALCCFSTAGVSATLKEPYTHYSDNESLSSLLVDFAHVQGFDAHVSDAVEGVLSGRFDNQNPNEFLEGLNVAFNVKHYLLDKTLYFYNQKEFQKSVYNPSSLSARELVTKVNSANIVSRDLPLKIDANGMIAIEGPKSYVENILNVIKEFDVGQEKLIVMKVFKLKNAKAEDIQISSMDTTVNIPGVASILDKMVSGGSNSKGFTSQTKSPQLEGLRGSGLAAKPQNSSSNADSQADGQASGPSNSEYSPSIIADSRLNAVIIQDYQYRMPFYKEVIESLDEPVRLVEIHAAIIDVDIDSSKDLGISWQNRNTRGRFSSNIGSGTIDTSIDGSSIASNSSGGGIFSTVFNTSHSTFMAQINALEKQNKAKTLGKPSILTMDNVQATLEDTTTNYIPISGYQDSDLFKVESGTVLRVTPHIIDKNNGLERSIQMIITLQSNQDSTETYTITDSNLPPIKQTKINTQALVNEGQSLLIGGYYVQSKTEGDSGVPGLKNIPLVGRLFRTDSDSSYTRERLLLITPKIIGVDEVNVPNDIDDPDFDRKATSTDYKRVKPKEDNSSGCSSNRQQKQLVN